MPRKGRHKRNGNQSTQQASGPSPPTASSRGRETIPLGAPSDTTSPHSRGDPPRSPTHSKEREPPREPPSSSDRHHHPSSSRDRDLPRDSHSPNKKSSSSSHRPSRSNETMESHISDKMDHMAVDQSHANADKPKHKPMKRPGYGTVGKPTKVDTNFFRMKLQPGLVISQYDVKIFQKMHPSESDKKKKKRYNNKSQENRIPDEEYEAQKVWQEIATEAPVFFNRAIFDMFLARHGREIGSFIAYDGRSIAFAPKRRVNVQFLGHDFLFTVGREGDTPTQYELDGNKTLNVKLRIDHIKDMKLDKILADPEPSNHNLLSAIDNVLSHSPMKKFVQVGRSFYDPTNSTPLCRKGEHSTVSAWRGFYQSARMSEIGLLLNIDESYTTFWNMGGRALVELIREANDGRDPYHDNRAMAYVNSKLKALKVRAVHNGITYKVHGFSNQSADNTTFEDGSGRRISVSQYFAETYNRKLRYGNLPCIKTHPKRDTYLPLELLMVVEKQRMVGLLSPDQTAVMVRRASVKPYDKKQAALSTIRGLGLNADPMCRDFGVTVDDKLVKVNARILPPPPIIYTKRSGKSSTPVSAHVSSGQWKSSAGLYTAAPLFTWAIINEANAANRQTVDKFLDEIRRAAERAGMAYEKPGIYGASRGQIHHEMKRVDQDYRNPRNHVNKFPLQLIMIIKLNQDASTYNKIKLVGDIELGLPSQVVLARNLRNPRGINMFCDNVMLKVNSKLGGQNAKVGPYKGLGVPDVPFINTPHIILGADVTHPMPGGRTPSVAALVGSRDREGIQYSAAIRNQPGKQEVITELGEMFKEVYTHWLNNFGNTVHTRKIIMFRDGVSEGQFQEVMTKEVESLRRACREISEKFTPDITYIIVTKRHHTKFFPSHHDSDRSGNVMPGTVVDREITSSEYYDFYLNSHAGIQGTNKPSKYTVLVDESKMSVDTLQAFVYRLAHGFVRCNRSVSMVNSAYYAHLLAFRGRAYVGDEFSDTASSASSDIIPAAPKLDRHLARRLFFV